ncbi:H-NS histone family protein [Pseudomonas sp. GX19020]|uniref:H-NS histone family protein n=1 Tax=Pseudomonas sp. GX19020 TaxID=2942277 RepID=UPI002019D164|nr:H-NS histone family protein [Pseudomonas sp. GX19020]MCL4068163.1 H-NS histone family protein [Pseudomonas sp. GX19020]
MSDINLDDLSLPELKKLEKDIAKVITGYQDRKLAEARSELEAVARSHGFSLEQVLGASPARKKTPAEAKYRHPENPEITWSGRGRKPGWIADALASGKALEDFAI